eukprot:g6730.t1
MGVRVEVYRRRRASEVDDSLTSSGTKAKSSESMPTKPAKYTNTILLSNHQTRLDWFFLWSFFAGCGSGCLSLGATARNISGELISSEPIDEESDSELRRLKIVQKDLSHIPFLGWCCAAFRFVLLSRKDRDKDLDKLHVNLLLERKKHARPCTVLLFPEGTDISVSNILKSHDHQRKLIQLVDAIPPDDPRLLSRVLVPKKAGLVECVYSFLEQAAWASYVGKTRLNKGGSDERSRESSSRSYGELVAGGSGERLRIVDLTIAFEGGASRPNETSVFVHGQAPAVMKILVDEWDVPELLEKIDLRGAHAGEFAPGDEAVLEGRIGERLARSFRQKEEDLRGLECLEQQVQRPGTDLRTVVRPCFADGRKFERVDVHKCYERGRYYGSVAAFEALVIATIAVWPLGVAMLVGSCLLFFARYGCSDVEYAHLASDTMIRSDDQLVKY